MTLRKTTIFILVLVQVGLIVVLLGSLNAILPPYFQRQEQSNAMLNIQRGMSTFNAQLAELQGINNYLSSNILNSNLSSLSLSVSDASMQALDIDLVAIFDPDGNLVDSRFFSLDSQTSVKVPADLADQLKEIAQQTNSGETRGTMNFNSVPLMVTSARVNDLVLITGRFLDTEVQQQLSSELQGVVNIKPFDPSAASNGTFEEQLKTSTQPVVRILSTDVVAGFGVLKDPLGNPVFYIEMDQPRTYFQNSQLILNYLIITMVSSTAIFALMIFLLIEWLVLRRLSRLNKEVQAITAEDGSLKHVTITRRDEMTNLSRNINQMLDRLASAQVELESSYKQVRQGRAQLQHLSRRLVDVQEQERHAIAMELHDEIGQSLTALKLQLESANEKPELKSSNNLNASRNLLNQLIERVRNLSLQLRPAMLDDLGLLPTLLWHFDQFTRQTGVQVDFRQKGIKDFRLDPNVEVAAYRIIQESLTNSARHSGVRKVMVLAERSAGKLHLEIADKGKGFEVKKVLQDPKSSGLSGIRERVSALGGRLDIQSKPGYGTRLTIDLPLQGRLERRSHARYDPSGG